MTDCGSCAVGDAIERRAFVRDAVSAVAVALGLAASAAALQAEFVDGKRLGTDKAYAIPAADGVSIDKAESVIIARYQGKVYAFSLACPHQSTALKWDAKANRFQCPKHHSRYQPDGVFIEGRATRGLDRFAVRKEGDQLMVNLDALYQEDKNAAEWKAAFLQLA